MKKLLIFLGIFFFSLLLVRPAFAYSLDWIVTSVNWNGNSNVYLMYYSNTTGQNFNSSGCNENLMNSDGSFYGYMSAQNNSTYGVYLATDTAQGRIPDGTYYVQINCSSDTFYSQLLYFSGGEYVNSTPITVNPGSNTTITQGNIYGVIGSFSDPNSATSWIATVNYGDGSGDNPLTFTGTNFSLSHIYNVPGIYTVTVNVANDQGAIGAGTTQVAVSVALPPYHHDWTVTSVSWHFVSNIYLIYYSNPTGVDFNYETLSNCWRHEYLMRVDGSFYGYVSPQNNSTYGMYLATDSAQGRIPDGSYYIQITCSSGTYYSQYLYFSGGEYIGNPIIISPISISINPVQVNNSTSASTTYTYLGVNDNNTAVWSWGDGSVTTGTITESNGSGSVTGSHIYTSPGVYTVTLTVTSNHGNSSQVNYQYISVYDSNISFAGGRSFNNPSSASSSTTGKVMFGISSKYNNSNILTGSVKMNFKAADIDFVSTSLQSLATSNGKAYLKGSGTVNGSGDYTFLATGIDGSVAGGNDLIRFQIKDSLNKLIYDSQPGASDIADPTIPVATGNVRVH